MALFLGWPQPGLRLLSPTLPHWGRLLPSVSHRTLNGLDCRQLRRAVLIVSDRDVTEAQQLFAHPVQSRHTDERYTPPVVFDALGVTFDLDVASPPGGVPWIPAARYYTAADDGLAQSWNGLVWCNPPFSATARWSRRFTEHGNGVLLFPMNADCPWMFDLFRTAPEVLMLRHLNFIHPTGDGRHVPQIIGLAGLGDGVAPVRRAAAILPGVLVAAARGSGR